MLKHLHATASGYAAMFGVLLLSLVLLVPAAPAFAQEVEFVEGEEAEDAPSAARAADRDTGQRFELRLIGTAQSGGRGDVAGTVTVTLRGRYGDASETYDIALPSNSSSHSRDRFAHFVREAHGRHVWLKGHLHGGNPRPLMHVTHWSTTHYHHGMRIDKLVGKLIDQRGQVFPGGEGTDYAVEATHNGQGTPYRMLLTLPKEPSRIGTIEIYDAGVEAFFVTRPQFVIVAHHYRVH